jgi:hypothetical protein
MKFGTTQGNDIEDHSRNNCFNSANIIVNKHTYNKFTRQVIEPLAIKSVDTSFLSDTKSVGEYTRCGTPYGSQN